MKTFFFALLLLPMSAHAADGADQKKSKAKACVKGKAAAKVFSSLDVEVMEKEVEKGTLLIKKAGPLFCARLVGDEQERNRCCFKKRKGSDRKDQSVLKGKTRAS